jgi:hypothetical protein
MSFIGAPILSALALATDDGEERAAALAEGAAVLRAGSPSHNHFWFHRDAMEVALVLSEWEDAERHATALEDYTRAEPLPWSDFYVARGRALAAHGRGRRDDVTLAELRRLRDEAERVGLRVALPALDQALAG